MVTDKQKCEAIFAELSRKWTITLIKDLFLGCKTFSDFLEVNENLSNKVLSEQLKRLEELGFIKKVVISTTPLKANYVLTEMGKDLNGILKTAGSKARDFGAGVAFAGSLNAVPYAIPTFRRLFKEEDLLENLYNSPIFKSNEECPFFLGVSVGLLGLGFGHMVSYFFAVVFVTFVS